MTEETLPASFKADDVVGSVYSPGYESRSEYARFKDIYPQFQALLLESKANLEKAEKAYEKGVFDTTEIHKHAIEQHPVLLEKAKEWEGRWKELKRYALAIGNLEPQQHKMIDRFLAWMTELESKRL